MKQNKEVLIRAIVNECNDIVAQLRREYDKANPFAYWYLTDDGTVYHKEATFDSKKVNELIIKYCLLVARLERMRNDNIT